MQIDAEIFVTRGEDFRLELKNIWTTNESASITEEVMKWKGADFASKTSIKNFIWRIFLWLWIEFFF